MGRVLFVDDTDADRGPMAEALARAYGLDAESVGTEPASGVTYGAETAMAKRGLHVLGHRPHWVDLHHLMGHYQAVIALSPGLRDACPDLHVGQAWDIPHPRPGSVAENEAVRDALERRVKALAAQMSPWT